MTGNAWDGPAPAAVELLHERVVETATTVYHSLTEVTRTRRRTKLRIEELERQAVEVDSADSTTRWRYAEALSDERSRLLLLDAHEERLAGVAPRLKTMAVKRRTWTEAITYPIVADELRLDMARAGFGGDAAGSRVEAGIDLRLFVAYVEALLAEADHATGSWRSWMRSLRLDPG